MDRLGPIQRTSGFYSVAVMYSDRVNWRTKEFTVKLLSRPQRRNTSQRPKGQGLPVAMEILKLYTSCPQQQAWRLIVQIWHLKNCTQGAEIDKETNILKPNQTHLNIQILCVKKYTRISVLIVKQGLSHWFVYSILPVQTLRAGRQQ